VIEEPKRVSARLRDAAGTGNCRAVGVTGAALQGVAVLLGQLESYAVVVDVDARMLLSRDLLHCAAISSGGGESLTAEKTVVRSTGCRPLTRHILQKSLQQARRHLPPKSEAVACTLVGHSKATVAAR
jgi:hypothetical protein